MKNVRRSSGDDMKTKPAPQHPTQVDTVSDETLRRFLGYHLKRASNDILTDLAETLKPFELRMLTFTALVLIVDNPGMRQFQLADAMDVERSNLVVLLDELEGLDLIVRDKVPTDRRAYALRATLSGRRRYDQAIKAVIAHERAMLGESSPEDIDALIAILRGIRTHLSRS